MKMKKWKWKSDKGKNEEMKMKTWKDEKMKMKKKIEKKIMKKTFRIAKKWKINQRKVICLKELWNNGVGMGMTKESF